MWKENTNFRNFSVFLPDAMAPLTAAMLMGIFKSGSRISESIQLGVLQTLHLNKKEEKRPCFFSFMNSISMKVQSVPPPCLSPWICFMKWEKFIILFPENVSFKNDYKSLRNALTKIS